MTVPLNRQAKVADYAGSLRTQLGLGTAATSAASAFATAAQGEKADTALQPSDIGTTSGTIAAGNDQRLAGLPFSFVTLSTAAMANLSTQSAVEVRKFSYSAPVCPATYLKVASAPAHDLSFQASDGSWWEIDFRQTIKFRMAGARGDGVADDGDALLRLTTAMMTAGGEADGEGLVYATSKPQYLSNGGKGTLLKNFNLLALDDDGWTDEASVLSVYGASTITKHSVQNFSIFCAHIAAIGLTVLSAGKAVVDEFRIYNQRLIGLNARAAGDGLNGARITNGVIREWLFATNPSDPEYGGTTDYSNRTAIGLRVESAADLYVSNVECCQNKHELVFSGNSFGAYFRNCKFWGNPNAAGASTATLVDIPLATAKSVTFQGCNFDDADLYVREPSVVFNDCVFKQGAKLRLIATSANQNPTGFMAVGNDFINQSSASILFLADDGASWLSLMQCDVTIKANVTTYSGELINDVCTELSLGYARTRTGLRNGKSLGISINNRSLNFQANRDSYSVGFSASKWTADADGPQVMLAKSRSTTVGQFGGYPQAGDILGRLGATGDRGADFGTSTFTATGGFMQVVAASNWTSTSTETAIEFATSIAGAAGNAVIRYRVSSAAFAPVGDNLYDIGTSGNAWKAVYAKNYYVGGLAGADGSFTTTDGKTVTITKGLVTSIA